MMSIISLWDIQWFRGGAFRSELWASVKVGLILLWVNYNIILLNWRLIEHLWGFDLRSFPSIVPIFICFLSTGKKTPTPYSTL